MVMVKDDDNDDDDDDECCCCCCRKRSIYARLTKHTHHITLIGHWLRRGRPCTRDCALLRRQGDWPEQQRVPGRPRPPPHRDPEPHQPRLVCQGDFNCLPCSVSLCVHICLFSDSLLSFSLSLSLCLSLSLSLSLFCSSFFPSHLFHPELRSSLSSLSPPPSPQICRATS